MNRFHFLKGKQREKKEKRKEKTFFILFERKVIQGWKRRKKERRHAFPYFWTKKTA
jgi:hypothetical protein